MTKAKLTGKKARFVEEYLIDLNATKAAKRAGYSEKTAYAKGHDLLKEAAIKEAIEAAQARLSKRTEITQERVLQEYARIAFLDIRKAFDESGNLLPICDMDEDTARAISALDVSELWEGRGEDRERVGDLKKLKLCDKKGALDSLARHLGMFTDKTEITGGDGQPFTIQIVRGIGE